VDYRRRMRSFAGIRQALSGLDLPDELMRRVKIRAAERNQKLKDLLAELIQAGLVEISPGTRSRKPPKAVKLRHRGIMTLGDMAEAIVSGRD